MRLWFKVCAQVYMVRGSLVEEVFLKGSVGRKREIDQFYKFW
jgi:hypothetical protein